ncbi:DUF4920 domain-containing protein [Pseudenhygromyxa sp. WMMC2535]|uniref:DUF4920 domain-containing protein n=1 Tax=Pseudenhygromyxa sp. WMMC2535 TaxID=2712867 RepID=UPI001551905E|nr:DUF4920 domain-containing protein [Pseudenhygromyxa sp. WMMC2535]NVB37429.1 DUF4920 domain-containing protein [Pseudenhygromyxa sp. WMMC2535]
MRSLSILLTATFALIGLSACDKGKEADKAEDKADKAEDKADEKADAKKAGEDDKVSAAQQAVEDNPEAGCIHGEEPVEKPEGSCEHGNTAAPGASTGHFGAEFAVAEAQSLSTVLAAGLPTEAVKVTGTVEAVCQKKGCWMVIKDGDSQARVLVEGHAFAIPMDGKGKAATVEGTLEEKQLDETNVAHLKKDGDDTIEGDGPRKEYFLHATAVELAPNA